MAEFWKRSLLPAIALIYLFGNQGAFQGWLFGESIYGPIGIVMGSVFWTFPHALIILITALSSADARLYEASESLGATRWRTFITVTLPGARYGLNGDADCYHRRSGAIAAHRPDSLAASSYPGLAALTAT